MYRSTCRNRHKCTKYKKCLNTMMVICIKQHFNNICGSIHGKVSSDELS